MSKIVGLISGEPIVNTMCLADKYPYLVISEYCLKIILTVLICMGVYAIMQKKTPKIAKILCGR